VKTPTRHRRHYLDQTSLYANQESERHWFSRRDIEAYAERKYHPGG
jgi:hypothetical protein